MAKKYYISFDDINWVEFHPSNDPIVSYAREGDEMFMRYSVDLFRIARNIGPLGWLVDYKNQFILDVNGDKITVAGNESVWDIISTMFFDPDDFNDPLYFKIEKGGVDTYSFKSSVNESRLDTQNGVFEISPRTDDEYQDIMDKYAVDYQDRRSNQLFGENETLYYPVLDTGGFVDVSFTTFSDVANTVTWSNDTGARVEARNIQPITTADGSTYTILIENFAGDTVSMELVNSAFANISTIVDITGDGKYTITQNAAAAGNVYIEMSNDGPPTESGSFDYQIYYPVSKTNAGGELKDIITNLLNDYMDITLTVKSTYLWNDALESDPPLNIETYYNANPTKDYVTEDTAIWNYLFLTRTDFYTTDQNELVELSFKDLMDIIKVKLRGWWFIDSDGDFRIEHEKYFRDYAPQIDLTTPTYTVYKPEVDAEEYTYDKGDIVSSISLSEVNMQNEDFVPSPVVYDASLTTPNKRDITIDVTTDMGNVIENPSSASNEGVMLLRTIDSFHQVDINESVLTPAAYYVNEYLSFSYLFTKYWEYFGEADEADINDGTTLTLLGVKDFLKQADIRFFFEDELNWKKPVTLTNGTGWLQTIEESDNDFLTLNVGFDPYA